MNTKFLNFLAILFISSFVLVSCNKDEDLKPETENVVQSSTPSNAYQNFNAMVTSTEEEAICYDLTFPITFLLEDGTEVSANSEDELETLFDTEPDIVDLVYPINLIDEESGETISANNEEELIELLMACEDLEWEEEVYCDSIELGALGCYDLVFPLGFVLEDGTIVTADTEADLEDILNDDNPPVDFSYPVTLTDIEDGTSHVVNNAEEVEELLKECEDFWEEGEWEEEEFEFEAEEVYKLTCISINIPNPDPDAPAFTQCYSYVYPVSLALEGGTSLTANNDEEMMELIFSNPIEIEGFVYPIQVTSSENGEVLTANNEEEVEALIESCEP